VTGPDGRGARVLFLYSTLATGGAERQLALLAPALQQSGFAPVVATLRERGRYFEELAAAGIETHFAGMRSRFDAVAARRAYRLWQMRPDVVFSSSIDAQVIAHAIATRTQAPHITAEHGGAGMPRALHRRLLSRLIAPHVSAVVAVSSTQTGELRALGYPSARIEVIPNGIPEPTVRRGRSDVRSELGIRPDDLMVLLAATLRPEKQPEEFIAAVTAARERDARIRGVIAGGGPLLERARRAAAQTNGAVQVLGERTDVPDLIQAASAVCLTSSFEGLPMIVLEAMALARPVVSYRVGGIAEAVAEGETGLLAAPGDTSVLADRLLELAQMPEHARGEMGRLARERFLLRYGIEPMIDRYRNLLARVTQE
jgi:glycosyltransferase involved in cell wall biosynthesis